MSTLSSSSIPWFGRKPVNPFALSGICSAFVRSIRQGRPQAGAGALPLTDASTKACFRAVGDDACVSGAVLLACGAVLLGGVIITTFAMPAKAQSVQVAANRVDPYGSYIAEGSQRFGIPEAWIRAVMRVESSGEAHAISPTGAIGLMQIMPATWAGLRTRYSLGSNPYDPHDNILAGTAYLREMHDRYGASGFLAAYNAGPGRYARSIATGRALPAETRAYVEMLAPQMSGEQIDRSVALAAVPTSWMREVLFAEHADDTPSADRLRPRGPFGARSVADLSGLEPLPDGGLLFPVRASFGPAH